jgi:hypothetical protein
MSINKFKNDFANNFKDIPNEDIIEDESRLLNKIRNHFQSNFIKDNLEDIYNFKKFKQDFFHKIFLFIIDYILGKLAMIIYFTSFIAYICYIAFIYFYGINKFCPTIKAQKEILCWMEEHLENFKSLFGYLISLMLGGALGKTKSNIEKEE